MRSKRDARRRRQLRVRRKVHGSAQRPRLCVYRSNVHTYAQVIDDDRGHTLVAASSAEPDVPGGTKTETARAVGTRVAQRALEAGIESVVLDRAGRRYAGRVKALAEAAREAGLQF